VKQGLLARRNLSAQVEFGKIMESSSPKNKSQRLSQHVRSALEQFPQQQRQVLYQFTKCLIHMIYRYSFPLLESSLPPCCLFVSTLK
jgi:hypothetical protein